MKISQALKTEPLNGLLHLKTAENSAKPEKAAVAAAERRDAVHFDRELCRRRVHESLKRKAQCRTEARRILGTCKSAHYLGVGRGSRRFPLRCPSVNHPSPVRNFPHGGCFYPTCVDARHKTARRLTAAFGGALRRPAAATAAFYFASEESAFKSAEMHTEREAISSGA